MDCNMPLMDGLESTRKICEMIENNLIPKVDIIGLTANIATADEEICRSAGMSYYLKKPMKPKELLGVLQKIFV